MTHNFSSKIFLTFIICLMPFSLFGINYEEAIQYKNMLMTTKGSIEQITFVGQCLFATIALTNLVLMLASNAESEIKSLINSLSCNMALGIVLISLIKIRWDLESKLAQLHKYS